MPDVDEQKTIELLRRKRGNSKATLTRLELYYSNITPETCSEDICIRLELIEKAYTEFKDLDARITVYPNQISELADFESRYCSLKAKFRSEANKRNNVFQELHQQFNSTMKSFVDQQKEYFETLHDRSISVSTKRDEIKLPKITIPPFAGNYAEFPSFKDLFEATIHDNESLSKVHKFKYLKGLLSGEAANIVKHIAITDANYDATWEKIVKRYDHKDHIMSNLIRQFLTQPRMHGSSKEIRQMADTSDEVLRGLEALGERAKTRDGWLIYLLLEKCDDETRKSWALKVVEKEFPTVDYFIQFLNEQSNALERAEPAQRKANNRNNPSVTSANISVTTVCPVCNEQHLLHKCDTFLALDVHSRRGIIADKKLCFNCMRSNHQSHNCRLNMKCAKCNRRHNTLLHTDEMSKPKQSIVNQINEIHSGESVESPDSSKDNTTLANVANMNLQAVLPTAMVKIKDGLGQMRFVRALLDSGSQASFIDETVFNQLKLRRKPAQVSISGLASSGITTKGVAKVEILSRFNHAAIKTDLFILERLPIVLPSTSINLNEINFVQESHLADPDFNKVGKIDMLLGADVFFNILQDGKITSPNSTIIAQNTIFGYIVAGKTNPANYSVNNVTVNMEEQLDQLLRRFWEIEELSTTKELSPEDIEIEQQFATTVQRNDEGRFVVRLPFKKNKPRLGNSLSTATKRFHNVERKLTLNSELNNEYKKFMHEYIQLNHMKEIDPKDIEIPIYKCFYLPHHAIIKASSITTKVRVVFDGSCRTSTGTSLNEILMVGPTIQSSLWNILLRFRLHKYVMTADIEKMYRQILVTEEDSNFQRIIWRANTSTPIKHYQLTTVTYGTTSAPFLATRCLHQLAIENMSEYREAANIIKNDFYVDDLLTGCDSLEIIQKLKVIITHILKSAGFNLRKWCSNNTLIGGNDPCVNICDESDAIKILGLQWFPKLDYFSFNVQDVNLPSATKRHMLSDLSKIFDPLGWLSPSTILVKTMFQQLWLQKLSWDDQLPDEIKHNYLKIRSEFKFFKELKITRWIPCSGEIELHVFADASEKAYAAVVFCRTITPDNRIIINLVTAKTKVAPIKQRSLPRLELCAAVLGTKLLMAVSSAMQHIKHEVFAWTDSKIVLAWLSGHPSRWTTFIGNRTAEILSKCSREKWSHVRSSDNPADVATRGILPSKLKNYDIWWQGPTWLKDQRELWPREIQCDVEEELIKVEMRKKNIVTLQAQSENDWFLELAKNYSSFSKLVRVIAYVMRFITNTSKSKGNPNNDPYLTAKELSQAEEILFKHGQAEYYSEEINQLKRKLPVPNQSTLKSLNPFLDESGVLRVGGRLSNSSCSFAVKHPIILHKSSFLSRLIVTYIHKKFLHPGPSLTFHLTRQKFWVINGRSTINQIVKTCITCARYSGLSPTQLMGQLPRVRICPARPFENTGVDFTGAISLANKRGRGARLSKGYISIFICLATKAIHIEVVTDCSTDGFIAALRRFIARRGLPSNMYSDNGTNFVGTDRKLSKMYKAARSYISEVQKAISSNEFLRDVGNFLAQHNITWHYTPPLAPHFAGIWESAVKSVKTHLAKVTGNENFTYEELTTLLCNIEAILNSRPLTASSTGDESYEALTPGHFLIGAPITSLPEPYDGEGPIKFGKMWSTIQQRTFSFWKRFNIEYLHNLQQRNKWQNERPDLKEGDVVLLKEQYLPPCKWAMGRIIAVHPGEDGHVRVVTIKTTTSTFKRPLNKVVLLPLEKD